MKWKCETKLKLGRLTLIPGDWLNLQSRYVTITSQMFRDINQKIIQERFDPIDSETFKRKQ